MLLRLERAFYFVGDGLSGSRAPTGLVVLVVDVVSAVLECRALPDAPSPFLSEPPAGALGAKYLRRIEAQPQIPDPDLVLDRHAGSVGRRTGACDQRNKLLGSQRAAGRTGGNQISPALRLNLMETHRGPAGMPGLVSERDPEWPRDAAAS